MGCLQNTTVLAFLEGKLTPAEAKSADSHLDGCADCRAVLVNAARTSLAKTSPMDGAPDPSPGGDRVRGDVVGRYVVLDVLGRGGMGVVYAAYDPELDRKVAVKLLRADLAAAGGEVAKARLVREGRAIARLQHPNVVAVHDVGESPAGVFVAMEYVEGRSLGEWLAAEKHDWRDILDTFEQA